MIIYCEVCVIGNSKGERRKIDVHLVVIMLFGLPSAIWCPRTVLRKRVGFR